MTEALPWPAQQIAEWMPLWKGVGFFFATFVLEDLAAVGAGLLLAVGLIPWPVAFFSCFLGIWFGDAGLYALARFGPRNWFERSSLRKFSAQVQRTEKWFAEHGTQMLVFSRCVPGARLPTYLAAGFLRWPLSRFLAVTGAASLVWTLIVLRLAKTLGAPLVHWVNVYKHGSLILLGVGLLVFAALQLVRRFSAKFDFLIVAAIIERWRHWEFWPAWIFYPPVAAYCLWLALRYRSLGVPTAANPGMFSGGIVGESKTATLKELYATSPEFTSEAELLDDATFESRLRSLDEIRARVGIDFPFILKPNVGQRGAGIKLILTQEQAEGYLHRTNAPLLVQRYAPGPLEVGVFYYRFPSEPHGKIFAITEKVFPALVGDGLSTVAELIKHDPRAKLIPGVYLKRFATRLREVLGAGEALRLVEAGNHAQGCIFREGMRLHTPELEGRIDDISRKLKGFFIGRYDIRFASEQDLQAGKNFQIIELNGAASEATSIYDPRNSLWSAYRTLFRQWALVFAIGAENMRLGFAPTRLYSVWKRWRNYSRLAATYPPAD
jgi:membrane protein DedA with SNARE-associated domain